MHFERGGAGAPRVRRAERRHEGCRRARRCSSRIHRRCERPAGRPGSQRGAGDRLASPWRAKRVL